MNIDIRNTSAVGDGKTMNTSIIQDMIDECSAAGGGSVIIAGGKYMTGTIELKNGVDLHIEADGVLFGSPRCEDYPERDDLTHVNRVMLPRERGACLIFAEEASDISITGKGKIDCNGESFIEKAPEGHWMPYERKNMPTPPRVVFFTGCKNVLVEDVTMVNQPAGWSYWIHDCDYVSFDRVKVLARVDYPNNDGIHINSSRNVTVSNCTVVCGDDSLIVRANNSSLKENKICERVTVTNCNFTSHSAGIRIGWINDGTIRNCTFSNIVMTDTTAGISISLPGRGDKRIPDEGREDTLVENLTFNNIIMDRNYSCPIFIRIADNEHTRCAGVRNIYFNHIYARAHQNIALVGRKNCKLKNIYFSDCNFEVTMPAPDDTVYQHGACIYRDGQLHMPEIRYAEGVHFNNTTFSCEE